MSEYHVGICKKCDTKRLLNKENICEDCINTEDVDLSEVLAIINRPM